MNDQSPVPAFRKLLTDSSIDLAKDLAQYTIDNLLDEKGPLAKLPIAGPIVSLVRAGGAIKEAFFANKLSRFLDRLNQGTASEEEKLSFRSKMHSEESGRFLSHVLILIERFNDSQKAEILAYLFRAYLREDLTWPRFRTLSLTVEATHPDAFHGLHAMCSNVRVDDYETRSMLNGSGLVLEARTGVLDGGSGGEVTPLGHDLMIHALQFIFKNPGTDVA